MSTSTTADSMFVKEKTISLNEFEVFVSTPELKFNCAHFIAFKGFREKLHGHNYTMSVRLTGLETVGEDGYVIDFGDVKKNAKAICVSLNETFLCPMDSNVLTIKETSTQLCVECEDGGYFSFPTRDCSRLPIAHSSAEEMAHYLWCKLLRQIGIVSLHKRGVQLFEVGVSEAPSQTAFYRGPVPASEADLAVMELKKIRKLPLKCAEKLDS